MNFYRSMENEMEKNYGRYGMDALALLKEEVRKYEKISIRLGWTTKYLQNT